MHIRLNSISLLAILFANIILVACGEADQPAVQATDESSTYTPSSPLSPAQTATPTPTMAILPAAPTATLAPEKPTHGELEVRFTDPETQGECVGRLPFTMSWGEPFSLDGGGAYQCAFEIQQCGDGVCIMYHSAYDMDFTLAGEFFDPNSDHPSGSLHMAPALTSTMKQWWSDIPPETVMAFTEDNPFVIEGTDILDLFFDFREGARAEIHNPNNPDAAPMVFILHLSP
jgi:hypothetical protein